jgi:hypothetical protein
MPNRRPTNKCELENLPLALDANADSKSSHSWGHSVPKIAAVTEQDINGVCQKDVAAQHRGQTHLTKVLN